MFTSEEIQNKVERQYIERLGERLKKMRKQYVDRNWTALVNETKHIASGAEQYGYAPLANEAKNALHQIETRPLDRALVDPVAKEALENLFKKVDHFLFEHR